MARQHLATKLARALEALDNGSLTVLGPGHDAARTRDRLVLAIRPSPRPLNRSAVAGGYPRRMDRRREHFRLLEAAYVLDAAQQHQVRAEDAMRRGHVASAEDDLDRAREAIELAAKVLSRRT